MWIREDPNRKNKTFWETAMNCQVPKGSEGGSFVSDSVTPWTRHSMEFSRLEYWSGSLSLLQEIFPTQESPALQADSLPAEPQGKPKNTGVGSLSLLQGIFLT